MQRFNIVFLVTILIRSIVEYFFCTGKFAPVKFITHSLLYYIIVYLFMRLLFVQTKTISEKIFKKIFLLFFLIPFIIGFLIPLSGKNMNYLEVNGVKEFFLAFFSLLYYSDMNILIKIEAFTIIPGIFLLLLLYFKNSILKSLLYTSAVYSFFLITGIFHYTTFITKYSPHDFMLMWQFLILSNIWMFTGRIKAFFTDIILLILFLFFICGISCIINWFNIIILVIVYTYSCYYISSDLKDVLKRPLFIIPVLFIIYYLYFISVPMFYILMADLFIRITILVYSDIPFRGYRMINNVYILIFSLFFAISDINVYNLRLESLFSLFFNY